MRRITGRLVSQILFKFVRRISEDVHVAVQEFVNLLRRPIEYIFLLGMFYVAFSQLHIPGQWRFFYRNEFGILVSRSFQTLVILAFTWAVVRFIKFLAIIFAKRAERTETKVDNQLVPFVKDIAIILVLILAAVLIIGKVFNIDIATLIAGLGIGGIAIALAARETLENLLASFTIFVDSPFLLGDSIQVGVQTGIVEKIGFRSTRLRTLDGSLVTIPNRLIVSQILDNQTQRDYWRAKYYIRLNLSTSVESMKKVIIDIQDTIDQHEFTKSKPGIARFETISDQSLDIMIIYYVETKDFRLYSRVKEEINFQIMQIILHHGVRFFSPLTTVIVKSDGQTSTNQTISQ
ncbi:MAG: mechanosensitive ion channel [Siphonobacter sp.]